MTYDIVVDGGGSGTRMALVENGVIRANCSFKSCNHFSRGTGDGAKALAKMLMEFWAECSPANRQLRVVALALSNISTEENLEEFEMALRYCKSWCEPLNASTVWLMNDIVPLVCSEDFNVAVIAGTGTGFAALSSSREWARASGMEYLLSDEGGGFDIGLRGLRAVVRAIDGRGPNTDLEQELQTLKVSTIHDLNRRLMQAGAHKIVIAKFAETVLRVADSGDAVVIGIVQDAASELLTGIKAVVIRSSLRDEIKCGYGGSLLVGKHKSLCSALHELVMNETGISKFTPVPPDSLWSLVVFLRSLQRDWGILTHVPLAKRIFEDESHAAALCEEYL